MQQDLGQPGALVIQIKKKGGSLSKLESTTGWGVRKVYLSANPRMKKKRQDG